MGQTVVKDTADFLTKMKRYNDSYNMEPDDIPPDNGFYFKGVYIPKEMLILILSYVDNKSLMKNCTRVCMNWNEIIKEVWKIKAHKKYYKSFSTFKIVNRLPWFVYRSMVLKDGYNRNLLKNPSGEEIFKYWKILKDGGDKWHVEKPPIGVMQVTDEIQDTPISAFVTSYSLGKKCQIIDLVKEGIDPVMLDEYIPDIIVSEKYAGRWDCNSKYDLIVELLDASRNKIDSFKFVGKLSDWQDGWKEVRHTFNSYDSGVRYIYFEHSGKDSQFWAGHYGSKMCQGSIVVSLTGLREREQVESSSDWEME